MSIAVLVSRGFGNGTYSGSIKDVTRRGYIASVSLTYPRGTLSTRGFGNPTTIAQVALRNYAVAAAAPTVTTTTIHPRSGIKKLTPAMLRKMQRRDAARTAAEKLRAEEEEIALWLLE